MSTASGELEDSRERDSLTRLILTLKVGQGRIAGIGEWGALSEKLFVMMMEARCGLMGRAWDPGKHLGKRA